MFQYLSVPQLALTILMQLHLNSYPTDSVKSSLVGRDLSIPSIPNPSESPCTLAVGWDTY